MLNEVVFHFFLFFLKIILWFSELFFFFWLFSLGVAVADHLPPSHPNPTLVCHTIHYSHESQ